MDELTRRLLEQQSLHDRMARELDPLRVAGIPATLKHIEEFQQREREMARLAGGALSNQVLELSKAAQGVLGSQALELVKAARGALGSQSLEISSVAREILDSQSLELAKAARGAISSLGLGLASEELSRIAGRFVVPDMSEYRRLVEATTGIDRGLLASARATHEEFFATVKGIRSPWMDSLDAIGSVNGILGLQSIGKVVGGHDPFSDRNADLLRANLGDWREPISWPKDIFDDVSARSSFYEARGFDPSLTSFPSAAFRDGLAVTNLSEDGDEADVSSESADDVGLRRAHAAHDRLVRLERAVRGFIEAQMLKLYGDKWIKQRVPEPIRKAWEEKRERAKAEGRAVEPLIAYADFTDYVPIITRKDNWEAIFGVMFVRSTSVMESFQRLYPLRNDTMHSREISQDDELFLLAESRRIQRAIEPDED